MRTVCQPKADDVKAEDGENPSKRKRRSFPAELSIFSGLDASCGKTCKNEFTIDTFAVRAKATASTDESGAKKGGAENESETCLRAENFQGEEGPCNRRRTSFQASFLQTSPVCQLLSGIAFWALHLRHRPMLLEDQGEHQEETVLQF